MEYEFRAWDKKNKKMIYFNFATIYGYEGEVCGIILPDSQTALSHNSGYGCDGTEGMNKDLEITQYAGIKDERDRMIFAGDIVKVRDLDGGMDTLDCGIGTVEYLGNVCLWYIAGDIQNGLGDINENRDIEVLGNIYQNPELLK